MCFFFFSSRRRHTRWNCDWSSDVCSSDLFSQREKYPVPGLLLLDLKMPLMDGFDVLAWLRGHPQFEMLPVVVLTASKLEEDIHKSRELGVYDYRVKPNAFEDLVRVLDDVRKCWLDERFNRFACGQNAS